MNGKTGEGNQVILPATANGTANLCAAASPLANSVTSHRKAGCAINVADRNSPFRPLADIKAKRAGKSRKSTTRTSPVASKLHDKHYRHA
jgi:hypothetical protein